MKTAYAYARFSSDNQREESIDAQVRAIKEYCQQNDIVLLRVFKDEAYSARTAKRPAFQELFGLIKTHPADYLIVHKSDRFARSREDDAFYRAKLKEAGMKFVSVLEHFDDTPESIILEGMMASLNEYYSANLARETKKGQKENILKGVRCGGRAPFGYTSVKQHLIPNRDADMVRAIFRMYADGVKLEEIKRIVNPPISHIEQLLTNEVYIGNLIHGEDRKDGTHEAIIDRETWDAVQRRKGNKRMNAAGRAKIDYMLSGLIVCGVCGKPMVGMSVKGKYAYYYCRTRGCKIYKRDELDKRVIDELAKHFVPTDDLKALFFEKVSARVNSRVEDEEARKARIILSQRIDKLIDSIQYAETTEDTKNIMAKVAELRRQMPPEPKPVQVVSKEDCDRFIEKFCDIQNLERSGQKAILKGTVQSIVVNEEEIILFMNVKGGICVVVNKKGFK